MGLLSLNYRRPAHVDKDAFRQSIGSNTEELLAAENDSLRSGQSGASSGVPDALKFDKIINGGTCPVSLDTSETTES